MNRHCSVCLKVLSQKAKGNLCMRHFNEAKAKPRLWCGDCGKELSSRQNRSGYCRICNLLRGAAEARKDPAFRQLLSDIGKRTARENFFSPEGRDKWARSRADVGRRRTEAMLGWCPLEYRKRYRSLAKRGSHTAATAKAKILEMIEEDRIAALIAKQGDAADHLRRLTVVSKVENGWRYGTVILTPAELVRRALSKGWEPDRWAA